MAITATDRGTGSHGTSVTSFNVAGALTGGGLTAGNTAACVIAMDNADSTGVNMAAGAGGTITDSAGNIWFVIIDGVQASTANANSEEVLLVSNLTANLTSSDTLTITLDVACTAKVWAFVELAPSAGNTVLLAFANAQASTVATAAPSLAMNGITTGALTIGFGGAERDDTWVGAGGGWSTAQHTGVGTGTSGQSVITQTVTNSSYGNPVGGPYIPTLTSSDVRLGYAQFIEGDGKARTVMYSQISEPGFTLIVRRALAAGSIGVLYLVGDNAFTGGAAGNFPSTATDTQSNIWTRRQNGVNSQGSVVNQGAELGIYTSVLTTGLVPGNTITGTYTTANVVIKGAGVWEFAPTGAGVMSYVTGNTTSAIATTTGSITTTSIANGNYVIGVQGAELAGDITADSDTFNGTWSTQVNLGSGASNVTSQSLASQWKKVTSAGAQTYNTTLGSTSDSVTGWIEINDSSPTGGLTAAQKAAFFQMF